MSTRRTLSSIAGTGCVLAACFSTSSIPEADGDGVGAGEEDGANGVGAGAGDEGGSGGHSTDAPCGDGVCTVLESCEACPEDCSCTPVSCGDGSCDPGETCADCPEDCGSCSACGDGTCSPDEDCDTCFEDCGVCACSPDSLEPNGSSGAASPITFGVDVCDLSVCAADVDWLELPVTTGFTATLTFFQAEGDLDFEIYSATTLEYVTGSYSADDDESVTLSGLPAGTYWARVYGKSGAENPDYCFRVDP